MEKEKPIVLEIYDFNQELAELVNKYAKTLPMTVILDKIVNLEGVLKQISEQQLAEAKEKYKQESEVEVEDGR